MSSIVLWLGPAKLCLGTRVILLYVATRGQTWCGQAEHGPCGKRDVWAQCGVIYVLWCWMSLKSQLNSSECVCMLDGWTACAAMCGRPEQGIELLGALAV